MARVSQLQKAATDAPNDRDERIIDSIVSLFDALPPAKQERVLRQLKPSAAPRAGEVLGAVVRLIPNAGEWTVADIREQVAAAGVQASKKDIYNAIGYLHRRKQIRRLGYGRYLIEGAEVVTSDDLGGEPARYED